MIKPQAALRFPTRRDMFAALAYVMLIVTLCTTSTVLLWNTIERFGAADSDQVTLARLKGHAPSNLEPSGEGWPAGSPFLEGSTVTLASAALLQRVTSAIARSGGSVISSEIEPQQQRPKDDHVKATAICEVTQASVLQQILYDLEAGMPFLFIDQLVVEAAPQSDNANRLRVRVTVSGLWPGTK
jgi:general secretion pathway protein M